MSYEIGTSTSAIDLLDKIKVVTEAAGWTTNNYSDVFDHTFTPGGITPHTGKWLSISKSGQYINLLATNEVGLTISDTGGKIWVSLATGYDNTKLFFEQPNSCNEELAGSALYYNFKQYCAKVNDLTGPFTSYRIFSGANYFHVVVEKSPDVFCHLSFGILNKVGTYTGGSYASGVTWYYGENYTNYPDSGQHGYMFDGYSSNNALVLRAETDGRRYSATYYAMQGNLAKVCMGLFRPNNIIRNLDAPNYLMFLKEPNSFNQITPLLPSTIYIARGSNLFSPVGDVPDFRIINIANHNPGDEITIGPDTWVVFPAKQKTTIINVYASAIPSSAMYGYAYKKVV